MCGIICVINKNHQPVEKGAVERAISALAHRGPDSSGTFFWENCAVGFTRLSIVDISGGDQPLFNEDRTLALVCNGEIYNFQTLRSELTAKGHQFRSHSDSEVILHLYEEDPENFVRRLDGMFGFVLVDTARKTVIAGRDRVGIKPLHFYEDGKVVLLSSEIKGLFAAEMVSRTLDAQGVYDAFTFAYIPGQGTAFQGVKNILPASVVAFDLASGKSAMREYWEPAFPDASKKGSLLVGPYAAALRKTFREAVASHTIGDVPVASYLSGGIDSTITTAVLSDIVKERMSVFSIKFQEKDFDESPVFLDTISRYGFDGHILELSADEGHLFPKVIKQIEQPQFSTLDIPLYRLSGLVREAQTKVVLAGEGADELFGGYGVYTLNQARRALSMPALDSVRAPLLERVLRFFVSLPDEQRMFFRAYTGDLTPVINRFGTYPAWYPLWQLNNQKKEPFFKEKLRDSLSEESFVAQLGRRIKSNYAQINDFDKSIYLELKTRLPNYILHRTDRNSMANSVEARVPYLSNSMIDFSAQIPPLHKMFGLREKYVLRKAFQSVLPRSVYKRRKYAFGAPNDWLWRAQAPAWRDELLSESSLSEVGLFNPKTVAAARSEVAAAASLNVHGRIQSLAAMLTGVLSTQLLYYQLVKGQTFS
jgi:asparagine synthase (glutamine-hydrolysing)